MSQTHAEFFDLCAAQALDCLDEEEEAKLERHLTDCVQCTHALADFREDTLTLAMAVARPPPPAAKARVFNAIREPARRLSISQPIPSRPVESVRSRFPVLGTLGWAAAAVLAFAYLREVQTSRQLTDEISVIESRNVEIERTLADQKAWVDLMASPDARIALLTPMPESPPAQKGWALFDPEKHRAILVFENLSPPAQRDLELWAIRKGARQSLGVLQIEPNGRAFLRLDQVPNAEEVASFAVTLEDKGGAQNKSGPSGPIVMIGTL